MNPERPQGSLTVPGIHLFTWVDITLNAVVEPDVHLFPLKANPEEPHLPVKVEESQQLPT